MAVILIPQLPCTKITQPTCCDATITCSSTKRRFSFQMCFLQQLQFNRSVKRGESAFTMIQINRTNEEWPRHRELNGVWECFCAFLHL